MKLFQVVGLCLLSLLLCAPVCAQLSQGGTPLSFDKSLSTAVSATFEIPIETMPSFDVQAFFKEDSIEEAEGDIPFRFGAPFDVAYTPDNSGVWDELPDGGRLWRLRVTSPGAYSINILYDDFWMPEGATLYIYNEAHDMVIGAFTSANNKEHRMFATAPVRGDLSIIEYYEPADVRGMGKLSISRIVHAYKDIFGFSAEKGFGSSGSCNNNVNCPEGEPWQAEKRAVAMVLLSSGTRWCSGAMINNVREDQTPYFLTANHCLGSEATWIIMFNYESPACANVNGPTNMTLQGTILRASSSTSDFGLLELQESPPTSFNVYFAGWSAINIASQQSVGIHHPSGDIKKISFDYDSVTSTEYLQTSGTTHWRVGNWEDGTTEGGSSGSPLFDPNHRIIGQLHGGYASCTSITADWYGKFAVSWLGGGSASSQLKHWLDPDNTGATTLDGLDPFAGTKISHTPLEDTRDTVNDYEVVCTITSNDPLVPLALLLHYSTGVIWQSSQLSATGGSDEYHAYIPAQSAGTTVEYYLTAVDTEGNADTTDTYSFFVDYSPVLSVSPASLTETLPAGDSATQELIIENVGNGTLDYTLSVIPSLSASARFDELLAADAVAPATRLYPDTFNDYIDVKGVEDDRVGYVTDKDAGGPDGYGYFWIDSDDAGGPVFDWVDISATGTEVSSGLSDDNYIGPFPIGFDFFYYGDAYTEFYIGSNGIIGFTSVDMGSRYKTTIPTAGTPENILAWLWDDLNITDSDNPGATVHYETIGNRLIIQFTNYPEYRADPGEVVTAEVILDVDGSILFQYLSIDPGFDVENCTVGIEDATGTRGLQVTYLGPYLKDDLAVKFFLPYQWLTVAPGTGSVAAGEADTVTCTFRTEGLEAGDYFSDILIYSNDLEPGHNPWTVPAQLTVSTGPLYICGDANGDEAVNVADAVFVINFAFKGGPAPEPLEAGDANCDTELNVGDAVYLINYVFKDGPDPCCP